MNELVTTTQARAEWNAQNGVELRHHSDILTAGQAAEINATYDIELHMGVHGIRNPEPGTFAQTQQEYDAAAEVVADMEPGDVLFVEGIGGTPYGEPALTRQELTSRVREATQGRPLQRMLGYLAVGRYEKKKQQVLADVEKQRQEYRSVTFHYAIGLARVKGIKVIKADVDEFERRALDKVAMQQFGKDLEKLPLRRSSPEVEAFKERLDTLRVRRARNVVKDWAIEHPVTPEQRATGRKPKLKVLFGLAHAEEMEQAFNEIGLKTSTHRMHESSAKERAVEAYMRYLDAAVMPETITTPKFLQRSKR